MDFNELLESSVKQNASDLHLCAGYSPVLRIDGQLRRQSGPLLHPALLSRWLDGWLSPAQKQAWETRHQVDFALAHDGVRLRGHAFIQRHGPSLALRLIPSNCPLPAELGIPPAMIEQLNAPEGLILVCGATGSGKSTTLASLIQMLNRESALHIITLEDPVEFLHQGDRALIQQRELGVHVAGFQQGLRAALREDPDVLLLGELRDTESIRLALTAAETGHLVLATLHTRGAPQAVERLVDVFPAGEKEFVRTLLAGSLRAVLAQQLLPRAGGGRVAAFELLLGVPAVGSLIREGKTHQLVSVLQTGQRQGMISFERSIAALRRDDVIHSP